MSVCVCMLVCCGVYRIMMLLMFFCVAFFFCFCGRRHVSGFFVFVVLSFGGLAVLLCVVSSSALMLPGCVSDSVVQITTAFIVRACVLFAASIRVCECVWISGCSESLICLNGQNSLSVANQPNAKPNCIHQMSSSSSLSSSPSHISTSVRRCDHVYSHVWSLNNKLRVDLYTFGLTKL